MKIERDELLLSDEEYNELVEAHNVLVNKKVKTINEFNRQSGRNVRVALFN